MAGINLRISVDTHLHDSMAALANDYQKEFKARISAITFSYDADGNVVSSDIQTTKLVVDESPCPSESIPETKWVTAELGPKGGTNLPLQDSDAYFYVKQESGISLLCQVETFVDCGKWRVMEHGAARYLTMDGTTYTRAKAPKE